MATSPRTSRQAIEALLDARTPEGRHYDYKLTLPESSDRDETVGIENANTDADIARLDAFIRDGVEPRIPGVQVVPHDINGKLVFVIDVPRSWALPHAVTARGHWRFYARNSAGKYPLDVGELRGAFEFSAATRDRLNTLRVRRLAAIAAGETPLPVSQTATTALHLVPLNSLDPGFAVDLSGMSKSASAMRPMYGAGWSCRYFFEGFATFSRLDQQPALSYTLLMRDGMLEAVDTALLRPYQGRLLVPGVAYEQKILGAISRYLTILPNLGVTPPVIILLSLLGVRGYLLAGEDYGMGFRGEQLDRDELVLPGVTLDDLNADPTPRLRPMFDALWNAFGYEKSANFDEQGNWIGDKRG